MIGLGADLMLIVFLGFAGRVAPGGALLSCLCKKVSKEAHPATRVPSQSEGQPAVLDHRVGPQNSLRSFVASFKQLRPVSSRCMCATWHTCPPCALCASARVEGSKPSITVQAIAQIEKSPKSGNHHLPNCKYQYRKI